MKKKICLKCNQEIKNKEQHCSLISYSKGEISAQNHWHRNCWTEWLNYQAEMRMKGAFNQSVKLLGESMPSLKQRIESVIS